MNLGESQKTRERPAGPLSREVSRGNNEDLGFHFPTEKNNLFETKISEINPKRCTHCHGKDFHPIWGQYSYWKGAYDYNYYSSYEAWMGRKSSHPRYKNLLFKGEFAHKIYALNPHNVKPYTNYVNMAVRPNLRIAKILGFNHFDGVASRLKNKPFFSENKFAIYHRVRCNQSFIELLRTVSTEEIKKARFGDKLFGTRIAAELVDYDLNSWVLAHRRENVRYNEFTGGFYHSGNGNHGFNQFRSSVEREMRKKFFSEYDFAKNFLEVEKVLGPYHFFDVQLNDRQKANYVDPDDMYGMQDFMKGFGTKKWYNLFRLQIRAPQELIEGWQKACLTIKKLADQEQLALQNAVSMGFE